MEAVNKRRTVYHSAFTRVANQFDQVLSVTEIDIMESEAIRYICQQKIDELKIMDDEVFNAMMTANASEDDLTAEIVACDEYKFRFTRLLVRSNKETCERNDALSRHSNFVSEDVHRLAQCHRNETG